MTNHGGTDNQRSAIALDVGEKRIGVAIANLGVRFARPLTTLDQPETFLQDITDICKREDVASIVIGLPRGMQGQDTSQTAQTRDFGNTVSTWLLAEGLQIPVYWIDEALTSAKAEEELRSRGKHGNEHSYDKKAVDALAATYILDDYLRENYG